MILSILVLSCLATSGFSQTARLLGQIQVPRAGFSNLYEHEGAADPTERYSILLSCFNPIPFTKDETYFFLYPGKHLQDPQLTPRISLSEDFLWPREPSQTPYDVFGIDSVTQPDGFLVPGKDRGSINIVDLSGSSPHTYDIVPEGENQWFYHRVVWKDVNGDGRKDALTCRARSSGSSFVTEMLWLEHPAGNVFGQKWEIHPINSGVAGVFSVEAALPAGGSTYDVIITAGYFTEKLTILWSTHPDGLWNDNSLIQMRTIDVGGKFFDLEVADLNNDGDLDLLVSINAEVNGTLVAYEIPNDFRTGEYRRHLLADGFTALSGLSGGGSPGIMNTFVPYTGYSGKPWIYGSADDEGTAWYFRPVSESPASWQYEKINIVNEGPFNIIGKLTAADFNGDGYTDLFVPSYIRGVMYVYTFAP